MYNKSLKIMKKLQIHEFNPVIYPFKLWIVVSKDLKAINESFTTLEGNEVYFDVPVGTDAWVGHIPLKYDGLNGILMVFKNKKEITVSNVAHETNHALKVIWDYLGEETIGDEANAYLAGWIAECIWKVKLNKE